MIKKTEQFIDDQQGAAAMLTVIFISIILLIMTIGFVRLSVIENRQTGDADLSARAYYATESGIEEAKRALRDLRSGALTDAQIRKDECQLPDDPSYVAVLSPADRFDVEITCMLFDIEPFEFLLNLDSQNKTVKVPLDVLDDGTTGPQEITGVEVEWHINASPAGGGGGNGILGTDTFLRPIAETSLLNVPEWVGTRGYPAMLDINIFRRPMGDFTPSDLSSYRIYANPTTDPAAGTVGVYDAFSGATSPGPEDGEMVDASCDDSAATGSYICSVRLDSLPSGNDFFLQVSNIYRATSVRITPYVGATKRQFDGGQAYIDITARSGDVFRRVRASLLLAEPSLLPDATITSAGSICKDFAVTDNPGDFIADVGTSCTH